MKTIHTRAAVLGLLLALTVSLLVPTAAAVQ